MVPKALLMDWLLPTPLMLVNKSFSINVTVCVNELCSLQMGFYSHITLNGNAKPHFEVSKNQ